MYPFYGIRFKSLYAIGPFPRSVLVNSAPTVVGATQEKNKQVIAVAIAETVNPTYGTARREVSLQNRIKW